MAGEFSIRKTGWLLILGLVCLLLGMLLGTLSRTEVIVVPTPTVVEPTITVVVPTVSPVDYVFFDTFTEAGSGTLAMTSHIPEVGNGGGPWIVYSIDPTLAVFKGDGYCAVDAASALYPANQGTYIFDPTKGMECKMTMYVSNTITAAGTLAICGYFVLNTNGDGYAIYIVCNPGTSYTVSLLDYVAFLPNTTLQSVTVNADITRSVEIPLAMLIPNVVDVAHPVTATLTVASGDITLSGVGLYSPSSITPGFSELIMQCGRQTAFTEMESIRIYEMSIIQV